MVGQHGALHVNGERPSHSRAGGTSGVVAHTLELAPGTDAGGKSSLTLSWSLASHSQNDSKTRYGARTCRSSGTSKMMRWSWLIDGN